MADEESGDDSGATEPPRDRRGESAAAPAVFQAPQRDLAEERRAAYADATAKLDRAFEAIRDATGTIDDKRAAG
jgi:hypothetical protein